MSTALRLGIMGLGQVTTQRHIPSVLRHPSMTLTGVIDRHDGRATAVAQKFALPLHAQTDSLEAVPWLDAVDALLICTPVQERAALIHAALAKGKHVLAEKPFALTPEEGEALGHAATQAGKVLAVVHNFHFSRGAARLHADLRRGKLGTLRHVSISYKGDAARRSSKWIESLPFGAFYDDSPHAFYLMRDLAHGALTLESSHGLASENGATPRLVNLLYRDEASVSFSFQGQYDAPVHEWFLCVAGDQGMGVWDLFRDIYIHLPCDNAHGALDMLKTSAFAIAQHLFYHIPNGLAFLSRRLDYGSDEVVRRFEQSIRTSQSDDKIGWAEAQKVLRQQHEAIKAVKENMRA